MKYSTPFLLLIAAGFASAAEDQSSPIVSLPAGKIQGTYQTSLNQKNFFAFEGVPYASPPIGKYKFKESVPPKPWSGVLQAKTLYQCLQCNHFLLKEEDSNCIVGDEDCLYLNIYTPNLDPNAKLDVVVYIHGGAFMFNYGGYQRPDYIMDRNVVYISLNYRLGPFGFLSTEDAALPGNMGLKDQTLALKWIQENVRFFGGNPASVTIIGLSAGGASVHLHLLSPRSKGLFHRAISQSGCALNPWVLVEKPLEKTQKIAALVGCPTEHTHKMAECLARRPGKQIVDTIRHFMPWLYNPFSPFGVVVDSWSPAPFLPQHPYELVKAGNSGSDVPWIVSVTNSEGLYPGAEFYRDSRLKEINEEWETLAPIILDYNYTVDPSRLNGVSKKIREHYLGEAEITKGTYMALIDMISDRMFVHDIEKTVQMYQKNGYKSPVYQYYFSYRGAHSIGEGMMGANEDFGASHGDDICYILNLHVDTAGTKKDREMMAIMLDMVTSFAKTGVPKVPIAWPAITKKSGSLPRLAIVSPGNLSISLETSPNSKFWDSLPLLENEKLLKIEKDEL